MNRSKYKCIYVICPPHTKTGGTELLHQLVYELNKLGAKSYIVYYNTDEKNIVNTAFIKYTTTSITMRDIIDDSLNLVVIPEIYCDIMRSFKNIKVAIWWLSVDNFLEKQAGIIGRVKTRGFCKGLTGGIIRLFNHTLVDNRRLIQKADMHLAQSYYAINYLKSLNVSNNVYYLSDYINDIYLENYKKIDEVSKKDIVLYNPKKGYKFTKKIIAASPSVNWIPLQNMTTEQVQKTMESAKVYIDFGNHPGKDRFPREAASCKCCVITGKRGSAKYHEDVMIPDEYKFDESSKSINDIIECIHNVLINYDTCLDEFAPYVDYIMQEKENFVKDIFNVFFDK